MKNNTLEKVVYYSNLIFGPDRSDEEWLSLQKEIEKWFNSATIEEQDAFTDNGCGEVLVMICDGILQKKH